MKNWSLSYNAFIEQRLKAYNQAVLKIHSVKDSATIWDFERTESA